MEILYLGEESLRQKSIPVENITEEIKDLVQKMFVTMKIKDGIGLAAPQIGKNIRIFVTGVNNEQRVFINPQIIETSEKVCSYEEGCLSIPQIYEKVVRPETVTVQYQNIDGRRKTLQTTGLLARVIQHENDHLDGVLFIDRIDEKLREEAIKLFEKKKKPIKKKAAV
ncbi:peptide deformylase [Treponema phagedenis]|uniref:peptide deformylase n=1 Tax=Treponema phagedenis TaxID=162 RepID=UPI0001F64146|nr:peptide deformylase [Treponema phagedenis]EFW37681.1 peptide deformylase [Treponema phagedenis F0421]TYT79569.1 peptide deformylase [Treponema phagedenis]